MKQAPLCFDVEAIERQAQCRPRVSHRSARVLEGDGTEEAAAEGKVIGRQPDQGIGEPRDPVHFFHEAILGNSAMTGRTRRAMPSSQHRSSTASAIGPSSSSGKLTAGLQEPFGAR